MADLGVALVVVLLVAAGLGFARLGRRPEAGRMLARLGFVPGASGLVAELHGRRVEARPDHGRAGAANGARGEGLALSTPLAASPIPYAQLARALGRGDLLAALYELHAEATTHALEARLGKDLPPRVLARRIDDFARLAGRLEALPVAEGLVRWYLELGEGQAPAAPLAALELVLTAAPEAEETLALCRLELDASRNPALAERARRHLESLGNQATRSPSDPNDSGDPLSPSP